jgi:eukaryotic-like serine/threonine-protein kinase
MLPSGTELGQYKIGAPLGAGGMGEVYRAMDSRLDREVAIKVLPPQFAQDQARLARFEREAKAVAALSHPNILAIHDFDTEQGQTFAVMELLEGETLRNRLAHGAIPWRKAVEIAIAIADGLSAAHAKGIIHRDLKPENIFLTTPGWVKILDFGLARMELPTLPSGDAPTGTYHPAQTEIGTILGTVGYMSPEQVRGKEADAKSDIFSLGCLLHEMVTGQRAFSRETSVETMTAILHDEPPDLADSGKKIPLELQRIIQHCLEKNPASRFHSAHDLAFALRAIQPDSKVQERGTPKGIVWGAAALALATIAALGLWLNSRRPLPGPIGAFESVAVLPFENLTGDTKAEPLSDGIADHLSINLSQLRDRDFKVTPFTSASRFRGPKIDLKAAGSALGVQTVVTGKLYQEGENLSISVALSDARADNLIWGQQFRGKRSEILALQDEIAKGLVAHLGLQLSDADQQRLLKHHTENPTAYLLYQEGMYHWHKFREESLHTAIDYFQRALKIDPQFARAHEGLGRCYGNQDAFSVPPKESQPRDKAALQKALELDNTLAEAHVGMGNYYMFYEHNWSAAESSFKEALRLNPRLADAHHVYGFYLAATGQTEQAIAELKTAKELDSQAPIRSAGLGHVLFCARQYDQQLAESQRMLQLAPNFPLAYVNMGEAYVMQGKHDEAAQAIQKLLTIEKKLAGSRGLLGFAYARWGKRAEAEKVLQEIKDLSQRQFFSGFDQARIYAGLGDKDEALRWLEKAYEERDWGIAWLKVDPTLDSLRADPKFSDLMYRMGLANKPAEQESGIQSVAVLPLENIGGDPKTEFLSDGIADQIINSLSQVRRQNLKVRPFSSVSRYKKQKPDLQTIARELDVEAIVTGSLHQQGDDLSIGIELVDARDNNRLWGKRYPPEKIARILDLQDQIARDVAANLRLHLTGDEEQRLTKRHTQSPEAYLLFREANFHLNKFTPEGIANSIAKCQQAIEKDPKFAAAHAALARAHLLMGSLYQGPKQTFPEARKHVAQALALDANQPDALSVLATSYMFHDWDWPAAEREFKRSIESDPSIGLTRNLYGFCLAATGRLPEALASIQSGRQLDPLAAPRINEVAMCRIWLRQYSEAIAEANKALELDPNFPLAHTQLAAALVGQGKPGQAIDKMKAAIDAGQRRPGVTGMLGYAYAAADQKAEAQKILQQLTGLAQGRFGIAIHVARIHAALRDKGQAFEWLQKARDEREPGIIWLKVDPTFDTLRSDRRFDTILQEMRLAP